MKTLKRSNARLMYKANLKIPIRDLSRHLVVKEITSTNNFLNAPQDATSAKIKVLHLKFYFVFRIFFKHFKIVLI